MPLRKVLALRRWPCFSTDRKTVYRTLKRHRLSLPPHWRHLSAEALEASRRPVPDVVIESEVDRAWVASLTGGEGCIVADYIPRRNRTFLVLVVRMSDREWVDRFAFVVGLPPSGRRLKRKYEMMWDKAISGRRALRVLNEILPYLYGGKREEAKRAIEFFSPTGYREGRHTSMEIWPSSEFPLRKQPLLGKT